MRLFIPFIVFLSIIRFLSTGELVKLSDGIVEGIVTDKVYAERKGMVFTVVKVRIMKVFKGEFPEAVTFLVKGGKKGKLVYKVSGEPEFKIGERVIVFLKKRGKFLMVKGMALGKFIVKESAGKLMVEREGGGISVLHKGRVKQLPSFVLPYTDFVTLIKSNLE